MRMYMYIKLIFQQCIRAIFKYIGGNMDSYITWKHILESIRIDKSGHSLAHSTDNPFNVMQPWSIYGTPAPIQSRSAALYRFQPLAGNENHIINYNSDTVRKVQVITYERNMHDRNTNKTNK